MAQRRTEARDDGPVVHVTIGRIELVANVAPQTTARRAAQPKSAAVPLSDYLRGEGGAGRRSTGSGSPR